MRCSVLQTQIGLQATKDPYVFDFLELAEDARERHLEQALIDDIQSFLSSSARASRSTAGSAHCWSAIRSSSRT